MCPTLQEHLLTHAEFERIVAMKITRRILCVIAVLAVAATAFSVISSAEDELSGVFNAPSSIAVGAEVRSSLSAKDDVRDYYFTVTRKGYITIDFNHLFTSSLDGTGWYVSLCESYSTDGTGDNRSERELALLKSQVSIGSLTTSNEIGVLPGTYFVRVSAGELYSGNEYTLKVNFTASDAYEEEYNDSPSRYTFIEYGKTMYGSLSLRQFTGDYDTDCYMFCVPKNGAVSVAFSHDNLSIPQVGWAVSVRTVDGTELARLTSKWSDTYLTTGKIGLPAGYYLIVVEEQLLNSATYALDIGFEPDSNRELEPNNTADTATPITGGQLVKGALSPSFVSKGLDKDYYKFSLESSALVDITFSHANLTSETLSWNIRVLDESFKLIHVITSAQNQLAARITSLGLAAGDYYICVDSDNLTFNSAEYTLKLEPVYMSFCETESNNTAATADYIYPNRTYTGALLSHDVIFDTDFYTFSLSRSSEVEVNLAHSILSDANNGWIITVYDEQQNILVSFVSKRNAASVSSGKLELPAGTYFVKVEMGLYGSEIPYYLKLISDR